MRVHSTTSRALAIALALAASGGAGFLLLKEDVVAGRWSDSFVLVPLILVITCVAGHLASKALRSLSILSALGFALTFLLGTVMTIYVSVGKQAVSTEAKSLAAVASTKDRSLVEAELRIAEARYQQAITESDKARSSGGCGRVCSDWSHRALEVEARVRELKTELKGMEPVPSVSTGAVKMARVINRIFGLEQEKVKDFILDVEQLAFTLLFELTAVTAFGYGLSGSQATTRVVVRSAKTQPPTTTEPPGGDRRDPNIVSWVEAFERRNGRAPRIPEVQAAFKGTSKTSAFRYAKKRHGTA